jgi:hypothetical protein
VNTDIQRPAFTGLIQVAAEARGDKWADWLSDVIAAATFAGWTWERIFLTAARLIVDGEAEPGDMLAQVQDPVRYQPGVPPPPEWESARAAIAMRTGAR